MKPTVLSVMGQDLTETFQTRIPGLPGPRVPVVEVALVPSLAKEGSGVVHVVLVPIDGAK